jgi:4-hydroxy-2-oxoheptanedioate aldolase
LDAFKQALKAGKTQFGLWSNLCSSLVIEAVADSGFDWLLLDMEHSPIEVDGIIGQLQAAMRGTATPIVRPPWNDAVMFKRLLDSGAQSLLVPYVQTAEEAARAVAATRYPPEGVRGVAGISHASRFGRISNYLKTAHEEICLLVQVETASALQQLEAIAAVDGVDAVFIGPSDLAASLGHIGNPQHSDVQKAMEAAGRRLSSMNKPAGTVAATEVDAQRFMEWGYRFVGVAIDTAILVRGADALVKTFKA